jgi:hypothetical protein
VSLALLLALLVPPTTAPAIATDGTDQELAGRAEAAFRDGIKNRDQGQHGFNEFRLSAAYYEELRHRGCDSPELELSLGNAYILADDLPHGVAAYRRGLRLSPLDPTLQRCLAEARDQVVYPDDTAFGRPPLVGGKIFLPGWAANALLALTALFYGLGLVSLTRYVMVRRWLWLVGGVGGLLGAGLLTLLLVLVARGIGSEDTQPLVVIAEDGVLLRKGDSLAFPPRYDTVVNRGVEARLLFQRAGWVQIELAAGEVGWVPRNYVVLDGQE